MLENLQIVSAGAGAGKTWRLSKEIVDVITAGVPADRILATTFTNKAAAELVERIRRSLLEAGNVDAADRFRNGYVGTMNSVFGRLVQEFALDLGLSPQQQVLAQPEASAMFQTVVADVLDRYDDDFHAVFRRMGLEAAWRDTVRDIIDQARKNALDPAAVRACADSSWTRLHSVLPAPLADGAAAERALKLAVRTARPLIPDSDTTVATKVCRDRLGEAQRIFNRNEDLTWTLWAQLSKLKAGRASREVIGPAAAAAQVHDCHPQLHRDLEDTIRALFSCAADAMAQYGEEKAKRGLVDFTDQEALALQLLSNPVFEDGLRDRIAYVFVDEFQDSSPLQLALVTLLLRIADRAVWVGDVKQAIFGFRDTDPALMNSVMACVDDCAVETLSTSYRSRESLVEFVNDVFVPVFAASGLPRERVELHANRVDAPAQGPALEAWYFTASRNVDQDTAALAAGVTSILDRRAEYLVEDKVSHELRPIQPADVAILLRKNDECTALAKALTDRGIRATVGETGLFDTPEAVVALAALRTLIDRRDTLALAELVHYAADSWNPGQWLEPWLAGDDDPADKFASDARIGAVLAARARVIHRSPTEALDLALAAARVRELALSWGDGDYRLANLEAIRRLAKRYEDACATNGLAATTGGLVLFLTDAVGDKDLDRLPATDNPTAVHISTYHNAKGLEWPVLIASSLNKSAEHSGPPPVFGHVTAFSTAPHNTFDPMDPLANRSLYYWPWPYGRQAKDVGLDAHVEALEELEESRRRLLEENIRLLYVGMTRARDYLVLATRDPAKTAWLDELTNSAGASVLRLAVGSDKAASAATDDGDSAGEGAVRVGGAAHTCRERLLSGEAEGDAAADDDATSGTGFGTGTCAGESPAATVYLAREAAGAVPVFLPVRFQPSHVAKAAAQGKVQAGTSEDDLHDDGAAAPTPERGVERLGSRLPITGAVDMALLGAAVHAFLAVDEVAWNRRDRVEMARSILVRFGVTAVDPDAVVLASGRLNDFVGQRYPDAGAVHREWPVHLRVGSQITSGWADLVIETATGWVLIDHKTFPGPESKWAGKAECYLPQLRVYAAAMRRATGRPLREAWIHMPIVGAMVHFDSAELEGLPGEAAVEG